MVSFEQAEATGCTICSYSIPERSLRHSFRVAVDCRRYGVLLNATCIKMSYVGNG